MNNIFDLPPSLPNKELFESLISNDNILIERIISTGQTTPPGEWYDQDKDEWVILLQGEAVLSYEDDSQIKLTPGDYLFIPAHQKLCKGRRYFSSDALGSAGSFDFASLSDC